MTWTRSRRVVGHAYWSCAEYVVYHNSGSINTPSSRRCSLACCIQPGVPQRFLRSLHSGSTAMSTVARASARPTTTCAQHARRLPQTKKPRVAYITASCPTLASGGGLCSLTRRSKAAALRPRPPPSAPDLPKCPLRPSPPKAPPPCTPTALAPCVYQTSRRQPPRTIHHPYDPEAEGGSRPEVPQLTFSQLNGPDMVSVLAGWACSWRF